VLRFLWFPPEQPRRSCEPRGLHLLGNDGVPVRGELQAEAAEIRCQPRVSDPVGLSVLWRVDGYGTVQLETTRLPEREEPYVLNVELARHRLMRITLKREEWGLFDYRGMEEISAQIDEARVLFIQALQAADDPRAAARLADESLRVSLWAGERMSQFHATVFLGRRHQGGGFVRPFLGTAISPAAPPAKLSPRVQAAFDFVRIPFVWRDIQPKEQTIEFGPIDARSAAARC
jgi:hypothetical protein